MKGLKSPCQPVAHVRRPWCAAHLTLGGLDLLENWTNSSAPADSAPTYLDAGGHQLVLEYAHASGTPTLELD